MWKKTDCVELIFSLFIYVADSLFFVIDSGWQDEVIFGGIVSIEVI